MTIKTLKIISALSGIIGFILLIPDWKLILALGFTLFSNNINQWVSQNNP